MALQLIKKEIESSDNYKIVYTWQEEELDATYLTSVAIGKFSKFVELYPKEDTDEREKNRFDVLRS